MPVLITIRTKLFSVNLNELYSLTLLKHIHPMNREAHFVLKQTTVLIMFM